MMEFIESLKTYSVWSNTTYVYGQALLVFLAGVIILKIFQLIVLARLRKLAKKSKTDFDDMLVSVLDGLSSPFYILISLYFALKLLVLAEFWSKAFGVVLLIVVFFEIAQAAVEIFNYLFDKYLQRQAKEAGHKVLTVSMAGTLKFFVKLLLWSIALLMLLSNLGVNVSSIVASMGIGGIAVALAAQNILSDMFSSFSIYFDRPFEVGDYIQLGTDAGTVEKIGLKTTRVRTMQGEELIISNQELTTVRVQNFKRMEERRVAINLGLEYGTALETLEEIPKMLEDIVKSVNNVRFDRCFFVEYADSSLLFELVYFVHSPDYIDYLAVNQEINLAIYKKFVEKKITFAYPSQTVYLKK